MNISSLLPHMFNTKDSDITKPSFDYYAYETITEELGIDDEDSIQKLKDGDHNAINELALMCEARAWDCSSKCKNRRKEKKLWERRAVDLYSYAAEMGNSKAMYNIGMLYLRGGSFISQSSQKALSWFNRSADANNVEALCFLGRFYIAGEFGVKVDYHKSMEWYKKAALNGSAKGMYNLGIFYHEALGVERSHSKAFNWYIQAAQNGHADAMNNIGLFHLNGLGINKNSEEAYKWFKAGAEAGSTAAMYGLAMSYILGDGVAKDIVEGGAWAVLGDIFCDQFPEKRIPFQNLIRKLPDEILDSSNHRAKNIAQKLKLLKTWEIENRQLSDRTMLSVN